MTVAELLARVSSYELCEWMALRQIEQAEKTAANGKKGGQQWPQL